MSKHDTAIPTGGVRMPKIIYGTAWKKEQTQALVEQALTLGFRGLDTACQPKHYDEAAVGSALAACLQNGLTRQDIYLQSKFTPFNGHDPRRVPYDPKARLAVQVAQSFATSLANLRTHYLDGLILHSPLKDERQLMEVWGAMEGLHADGVARQLGISNCYSLELLETLHKKAKVKPAVVQNRFYADTGYDREIRDFCRRHRMVYQSFWTLTANPQLLEHPEIGHLAEKYQRTPEQVLFRWLTQNSVTPLTGTSSAQHMREDLAIFDFKLEGEEFDAVDRLL